MTQNPLGTAGTNSIKLVALLIVCISLPPKASANPVMLNPSSLVAFCVVAFWALVIEAGVVALILACRGAAALPVFVGYLVLNGVVFLFLFQPLLTVSRPLPLPLLEVLVVLADTAMIKLLVALSPFRGDSYQGVSWVRSVLAAGVGNGLSYFVGVIATRRPWDMAF